jgi:hypothetical protein
MVHFAQTVHRSCTNTNTISKWTENDIPLEPCHLGVPSGAPTMISEPMVHSVQTAHLYCTDTNIFSKQTKNDIPLEPRHLGVPSGASKTILSLGYIRWKSCTYLASKLALSPNRLKQVSTRALSPRSTIGCIQNDF